MSELKDVFKWMAGYDAGLSSKAIAMHMTSGWCAGSSPSDTSDLGRCLRLLEKFQEWKPRIYEMAQYSKHWRALVEKWAMLEQSMIDEVGIDWSKGRQTPETYNLMQSIFKSAEAAR